MAFDPHQYGPVFTPLLDVTEPNPLGPGDGKLSMLRELRALSLESAFAPRTIRDRDMARACLAGLWLLHDGLDESHKISQEIETPTGSFWHAIMHRREPDYDNAKYWFRRVGQHGVFEPLHAAARELATGKIDTAAPPDRAADFLRTQAAWDPFRFVDLCAAVAAGRSTSETLCRRIQRREWELLFDYCFAQAVDAE